MFTEEARWIGRTLSALQLAPGAAVLDIGSSTLRFRTRVQPHIDACVFAPLRERGLAVVHLDAKDDEGVDVVCDITDPAVDPAAALGRTFDVVLCTNLLEHVADRERTARVVLGLAGPGGYLVVTVPRRYRRHLDPIDTMYRPRPDDLAAVFTSLDPRLAVLRCETVRIDAAAYYKWQPSRIRLWGHRERVRHALPPLRWAQACVLLQLPRA